MKYCKRYEAYIGARTTETMVENFLSASTKALSLGVPLKDTEALKKELKNDYIIKKELSTLSGGLSLRFGRFLAAANAFFITLKYIDFSYEEPPHTSRDSDGYPISGVDEVDNAA